MQHRIKVIQQQQIEEQNISPSKCIEWAKEGFFLKEKSQMPPKMSVHPQGEDFLTSMPCLLVTNEGKKYFGIKIVSRIEGQTPTLQSQIYLYQAESGSLLAIIDGNWITAMRTGAVAALAAKTFQKKGTDTYSLIGLGNIARAVVTCMIDDNKDRQITFRLMRYKDQAEAFISRFSDYKNVNFEIIDDKHQFAANADVIISCITVAKELLFPDDNLFKKGVTLIPVHTPGFQNCDLFFDKVFGDDTEQIRRFKYFDRFKQYDELTHVLQGKNPGRTNDEERILSYNYGMGLHDILFASKIFELTKADTCSFELDIPQQKIWF
jgi:ornithine cyclodeaminase